MCYAMQSVWLLDHFIINYNTEELNIIIVIVIFVCLTVVRVPTQKFNVFVRMHKNVYRESIIYEYL